MSHGSTESGEPNLTPILDMVFQLITFFMLVINFQGAALDMSLKLPVLGSAQPVDTKGQEELLVLNVDSAGRLTVYGVEKNLRTYISGEARLESLKMQTKREDFKLGDELATTIVVRADKSTSFKLLNQVIKTCQEFGYRKFALKAMTRKEGD